MNRSARVLTALGFLSVWMATGCAVGNKHHYHDLIADVAVSGNKTLAVATHDQRDYVRNGDKPPNFVGLQRGGYGNPFDVTTASGDPLAADLTAAIKSSLERKGVHVVPVATRDDQSRSEVLKSLQATGADRLALLTLLNWRSDTYTNTALAFDVTLDVYDKHGSMLGESHIEGKDDLGGSVMNPPKHAKRAVPAASVEKLEKLFGDPEIQKAFR